MGNQNNVNVFGVHSRHCEPKAKHQRKQSRVYSPDEFLAMPMVQEFISKNPNQYLVNDETGEQMMAQELAELYCSVNNGKKMKKALRRAFGDKA
ncbi:MAG: hypothetical protein E6995_14985 [Enterobacteriaceae bacterium]|uniref:hypothetical protein n=1 Tax=Hafnia paralvei TaxID=546367 RepID=UPI000EC2FE58|nr:hypothetical protein [Hafnia paralvei]MDU1193434.1 hypothetical protein [Enterobacteriaceae bacterium]MDU1245529.1 hypothetical protein [Enterobacteriaceae bacterium]HCU14662.1 hypothetical protein [Hafnia paralvei]